jgi:hypothetical protein
MLAKAWPFVLTQVFADLDMDVMIGENGGTVKYFRNIGTRFWGVYQEALDTAGHPLLNKDLGVNSAPACIDVDGDHDTDCFFGTNEGTIGYYENVGTATAGIFRLVTGANNPFDAFDLGTDSMPAFVDWDSDGDFDCFVGDSTGAITYYKNTGTATAAVFIAQTGAADPFDSVDVGTNAAPAIADMDGDGDMDVFVGTGEGTVAYYKNTGTPYVGVLTAQSGANNPMDGVDIGTYATPALVDSDSDFDKDMFIGEAAGTIIYYANTGTASAPAFTLGTATAYTNPLAAVDVGTRSAPFFLDLDAECSSLNNCNFHGVCTTPAVCHCYDGYGSVADIASYKAPDCSQRVCPAGKAWVDIPTAATVAHAQQECSNKGVCDRSSGKCLCFDGFGGDACQRMVCPTNDGSLCSGHGRCVSMSRAATLPDAMPLSDVTTYEGSIGTTTWDQDMIFGCVCDSGWTVGLASGQYQQTEFFGPDCSLKHCPTGDDPSTTQDETDCGSKVADGGFGTGATHNKCHVDCSNRGTCNYQTGLCKCFEGYYSNNCGKFSALAVKQTGGGE